MTPRANQFRLRWMPWIVTVGLILILLVTFPRVEKLGDRYRNFLPIVGGACAVLTGSAPEYALRFAISWSGVHTVKTVLGESPLNQRPAGDFRGMPSGHAASSAFGASSLVNDCVTNSLPAKVAAIVAAGYVGNSRVVAERHNIWQVLIGTLWAIFVERAFRREGPVRSAIIRRLQPVTRPVRRLVSRARSGSSR